MGKWHMVDEKWEARGTQEARDKRQAVAGQMENEQLAEMFNIQTVLGYEGFAFYIYLRAPF